MASPLNAVCAILAGGEGRRLGGLEKATLSVGGQRLVDRVIQTLQPQCMDLALCLQSPKDWADKLGLQVLCDRPSPGLGPVGGIAAAVHWASTHPERPRWVITSPVDTPFLSKRLVEKLTQTDSDIAVAKSGHREHFTVAAWRTSLSSALEDALTEGPIAVRTLQARHSVSHVTWPVDSIDPFLNINTSEDIETAERLMTSVAP